MQRLEISGAVRLLCGSLGVKWLKDWNLFSTLNYKIRTAVVCVTLLDQLETVLLFVAVSLTFRTHFPWTSNSGSKSVHGDISSNTSWCGSVTQATLPLACGRNSTALLTSCSPEIGPLWMEKVQLQQWNCCCCCCCFRHSVGFVCAGNLLPLFCFCRSLFSCYLIAVIDVATTMLRS